MKKPIPEVGDVVMLMNHITGYEYELKVTRVVNYADGSVVVEGWNPRNEKMFTPWCLPKHVGRTTKSRTRKVKR